jgi:ribosomal protein S12 methylthiotransferase accessory factor
MFNAHPGRAARAAFIDSSGEHRETSEVASVAGENVLERIEAICGRLEQHGVSAYAVDVTSPDVRSAGLLVVHAIAPELCQLDVVHGARFLGGRRLYEAAYEAGLVPHRLTRADLNPDPHPFP